MGAASSCWDQYLSMVFAQLTYRESPRDIEARLVLAQRENGELAFPFSEYSAIFGGPIRTAQPNIVAVVDKTGC